MKTRLPLREIRNGGCGSGDGDDDGTTVVAVRRGSAPGDDSGEGSGDLSGGNAVGRKVSSLGANLAASSLLGNSMAAKISGTSVRTRQNSNIKRDEASSSEFFLRKLMIDLNCGPGSASLRIGSTISPAPP